MLKMPKIWQSAESCLITRKFKDHKCANTFVVLLFYPILICRFYASSFFILKIVLKIPLSSLGALTTTIFKEALPPLYLFTIIQTPAPIKHNPSRVIRIYLGIIYARNNPAPTAIKKNPTPLLDLLQQHLFLLITPITHPLITVYSIR